MDVRNDRETPKGHEYTYENETGDAKITTYQVFSGIEVAYVSVHMDQFDFSEAETSFRNRYIGFHYCLEGRIEQEVNNEFFYLMPGDCSVVIQDKQVKKFCMPLKHYHGISIGIDTDLAPKKFSEFLEDDNIDPIHVAKRLCKDHHSVILRSVERLKTIFTESYSLSKNPHVDHLKIKLLELFYVLSRIETSDSCYTKISVPRMQVELVKQVTNYISENLNDKFNLKDLTAQFGVSDTHLQNAFRAVYGMPVMSFMRVQKMQSAAQILIHTDRSIDDIAQEFGYENESKFSAAFKKIIGDSPSVYRKEHLKIKIL